MAESRGIIMKKNYEELKIVACDNGEYFFYDSYGLEDFMNEYNYYIKQKIEVNGVLVVKDAVGGHQCCKSALWDDMEGYVDTLQNENELLDNQLYIVTYYQYDGSGLEQLVEYGITKQQIIENINNQKYVEGASYFTMDQLMSYEELVA
jgi:hypothetical protein